MHMATATRTNEHRDPHKLKNHPLNIKLYGGKPPKPEFIASVKKHGILEPLLINVDDVVIAGHTRKDASRIAGLKEVPVIVLRDVLDPLDQEELLIISNRQREKDNETLAREAARLATIEEERAAARLKQTQAKPGEKVGAKAVAHAPQPTKPEKNEDSGRAREKVADTLGVGQKSAGKLIEVGRELERAEESGDTEKAEEIKAGLQKSVSAGHKAAKPSTASVIRNGNKTVVSKPYDLNAIEKSFGGLARLIDDMASSCNLNNSPHHRQAIGFLTKAMDEWKILLKECDAAFARRSKA